MAGHMVRPGRFNARYPVSASLQVADLDGDGREEFIVSARDVWRLPSSGQRGAKRVLASPRPFASTACVVKHNGRAGVAAGSDDGSVHASWASGGRGGALVKTGLDVYSSPVSFESKEHGRLLAFGSDDGGVWCTNLDGVSLPGFPVMCGAFVSATPAVADFDGDGEPEILVGDWAGRFHALRLDAAELPSFPLDLGWPVWSSACVADLNGDRRLEVVVATRKLHAFNSAGQPTAGFPQLLGTYAVSSPIVVDLLGDGRAAAVVGSDKLYAFDGAGNLLAGFPRSLGAYIWASPVAVPRVKDGSIVLFVGSWDHALYEVSHDGHAEPILETRGPIFATAGVARLPGRGVCIAAGSWDGRVYLLERDDLTLSANSWPTFHRTPANERTNRASFEAPARPPGEEAVPPTGTPPALTASHLRPSPTHHRRPTFVVFDGENVRSLARAQLVYTVAGEARAHPSPAVVSGEELTSLVQPLGVGRVVRYHLEGTTFDGASLRFPADGEARFTVSHLGPVPIGGIVARLEGRK